MDRFGSSRLRIVWVLVSLLLSGFILGALQGFGSEGNSIVIFGKSVGLGMDFRSMAIENLGRLTLSLVSATIFLGGVLPLGEWVCNGARSERFKAISVGVAFAILSGLLLSQVALLPILAACFKLFGLGKVVVQAAFETEVVVLAPWKQIFQADLNGIVLGVQLLAWASAISLIFKSNRGLAILTTFALLEINKLVSWVGEFGDMLEMSKFALKSVKFLEHTLPMQTLPGDKLAWSAVYLGIGIPLLLAALLALLPSKGAKKSKA